MKISGITIAPPAHTVQLLGGEQSLSIVQMLYETIDARLRKSQTRLISHNISTCINTLNDNGHTEAEKRAIAKETKEEIIGYQSGLNRVLKQAEQRQNEFIKLRAKQNNVIDTGTVAEIERAYENKFYLNILIGRTQYRIERIYQVKQALDQQVTYLYGIDRGRL